ncbi:hypothetical protein SCUCBS95973_005969 [Sporothrix curviconia]|uniref:HAUS augmin-like complex subunit 6 N-terminal domain-containing protein n=1 Tax=Sporothrix curviconia TaxID=1260050 RepID=A0ABP0C273_9PEZI
MATASSTSLLSRTRPGRLPSGGPAASHDAVTASTTSISTIATASSIAAASPSSQLFLPSSNVAVFLTNLRLLDLDLLPDWPNISARTFAARDAVASSSAQNGQKRRIQSVEWALYNLFCLWDPHEARAKMQPLFPPADQVQSVTLRAAFLRGLEAAKKTGALGRDAILRKTMLDECRGERFEEILAVFSSAVLKRVVEEEEKDKDKGESTAVAKAVALENRGYSAERTQLHALILAHKASLSRTLCEKEAARARYHDFAELLALKERSLARRRELAKAAAAEDEDVDEEDKTRQVSDDVKLRLQRLVRNNWSGSEAWMASLVHGDECTSKDELLSTPADRVWRRVQAGRLGELESRTDTGLLDQLDRRVTAQRERLHQWREYSQHVLRKIPHGSSTKTAAAQWTPEALKTKTTGIDFEFDQHTSLHPSLSPRKGAFGQYQQPQQQSPQEDAPAPPRNDDYDSLLKSFQDELATVHQPRQGPSRLTLFLDSARKAAASRSKAGGHARKASRAASGDDDEDEDVESEISDMDEHPIIVQQQQQQQQSAPPSENSESPTRRRVLLTKTSMTFSVKSYHSDDEPSPPREFLPPKTQRAATIQIDQPLPPAVRKLSGQMDNPLAIRRRQQSPPIRPPRAAAPAPPPAPRTPSPDRSPPPPTPPSDDDGPFELVSTPRHSIMLQPPPASEGASSTGASPTQDLADQILASMSNASPSPIKRPRHTLSLAERTRMSMARASRVGGGARTIESDDEDASIYDDENAFGARQQENATLALRRQPNTASLALRNKAVNNSKTASANEADSHPADDPDGLIARTRKSMAGFEAARQKAQLDRRRSLRKSRQSSLGVGSAGAASAATSTATSRREAAAHGGYFPPVNEGDGDEGDGDGDNEPEDTTMLAEELMSGGQDDAEAIFRSRPKIKMSPIPSPTRELDSE